MHWVPERWRNGCTIECMELSSTHHVILHEKLGIVIKSSSKTNPNYPGFVRERKANALLGRGVTTIPGYLITPYYGTNVNFTMSKLPSIIRARSEVVGEATGVYEQLRAIASPTFISEERATKVHKRCAASELADLADLYDRQVEKVGDVEPTGLCVGDFRTPNMCVSADGKITIIDLESLVVAPDYVDFSALACDLWFHDNREVTRFLDEGLWNLDALRVIACSSVTHTAWVEGYDAAHIKLDRATKLLDYCGGTWA